jgi:hypothetical protein
MATGFLPTTLATVGSSISIVADGDPITKPGGMTLAWGLVAAVSGSDVTYLDGITVAVGDKALRYGQLMCEVTQYEVDTITLGGGYTGGTFPVTVVVNGVSRTTPQLAYNASAATVQAAVEALDNVGPGAVSVSYASNVFTFTFNIPGTISISTSAASLTGGTPTAVAAEVTASTAYSGQFGPYDPSATDGRQTMTRGKCFWIMRTVQESDRGSAYAAGLEGGRVFLERLIQSGVASASLAAGPTLANVNTAFPGLRYA